MPDKRGVLKYEELLKFVLTESIHLQPQKTSRPVMDIARPPRPNVSPESAATPRASSPTPRAIKAPRATVTPSTAPEPVESPRPVAMSKKAVSPAYQQLPIGVVVATIVVTCALASGVIYLYFNTN